MENKNKKIISILGDSISTFAGYTPAGAVFYDDWRQRETGVADPGATWWMQVIEGLGGVLGVNNSYSGSTVSCGLLTSGTSLRRLETLGAEGDPDIILVSMGANDWGFGIHPQEFERVPPDAAAASPSLSGQHNILCHHPPRTACAGG